MRSYNRIMAKAGSNFEPAFLDCDLPKLTAQTTVAMVGFIFRVAVRVNAAALMVAHLHPAGDPSQSPEDVVLPRDLVKASKLLGWMCRIKSSSVID
jgi:hypothetical protein